MGRGAWKGGEKHEHGEKEEGKLTGLVKVRGRLVEGLSVKINVCGRERLKGS